MQNNTFSVEGLFDFLNAGVSAFHSTAAAVKILEENGYRATRVRPVDMFPMGGHCECVVKLERVGK
mgnify:FL=1